MQGFFYLCELFGFSPVITGILMLGALISISICPYRPTHKIIRKDAKGEKTEEITLYKRQY